MLELIFQGFAEWLYDLVLEAWEYFASAILDVMSLDFAYLESHIPAITSIRQVLLAGGWALLIGNLVFQAIRSMVVGLGFEGEDPKLLFTRSFVFSFLLFACPQICDLCLDMTSMLMQALEVPSAVDVHLVDSSVFGSLSVSWLLIIIFNIIIMFQVFKLLVEVAERYVILGVLTMVAPMAFGVGGSKSTADIFTGWCRMYGSMCFLMVSHVIFLKMLLSVLSAVPSGLDTFLWMILVLSIVKVAKKADSIITRIGLNPAFTGDALHTVPGALSYVLLRQATAQITKSLGKATGGTGRGRSSGFGPSGWGPRSGGPRGTGSPGGSSYAYNNTSASTSSSDSVSYGSVNGEVSSGGPIAGSPTAPFFAPAKGDLSLPGGKPPYIPPSGGPVMPNSPMPSAPASQPHQSNIQLQNGQGNNHPPEQNAGVGPQTPGKPSMIGGVTTSFTHATAPADMPHGGIPGQPGKTGATEQPIAGQPTSPSPQAGQSPVSQVGKATAQKPQHGWDVSPAKAQVGYPSGSHLSQFSTVQEQADPGSAVTTSGRGSKARFSHRENHLPGRVSSLNLQSTLATRDRISPDAEKTPASGTRFTARHDTPGSSGTPSNIGVSRGLDTGGIQQKHISSSETSLTMQASRQAHRQKVRDVPGVAEATSPSAPRPASFNPPASQAAITRPDMAGKPSSPSTAPPSSLGRQGRNGGIPTHAEPSRVFGVSSPAQQETHLGGASPAPADPASRPSPGTAGIGAPSTASAPDRAPRHSRNEVSAPTGASVSMTTSIPARQEGRPPVPAQPKSTAPTLRSGPGIAETAHLPGQTASPVQTVTPPTRSAASAQPVRPGGQMTAPAQPAMRQSSPAAKVTPAVKATPAPTDTRYKKGYPAKSTKGGRKRHGR